MRILFISDFYPPLELGGWEQLTQEIAQRLAARGHVITVLTSRHRIDEAAIPEPGVHRLLHLESEDILHYHPLFWLAKGRYERENQRHLEALIADLRPDIVFIHSMWNLPRSLAWHAEQRMPGRVVYYVASKWPYAPSAHEAYWQAPTRRSWLRWPKRLVAAVPLTLARHERRSQPLEFQHVLCASHAVRQDLACLAGIPLERSRVVHNGIDTDRFAPPPNWDPATWKSSMPAFLYAGSLIRTKGVHTAIEGFVKVAHQPGLEDATLTIVGAGTGDPAYEAHLRRLVRDNGFVDRVHFLERIERRQVPALWNQFDILLVPSHFEAMPRIVQEGMACGLVVLGTSAWGAGELLQDGETGLTFDPEDAEGLACQISRLVADPELRCRLARAGRQAVVERFSQEQMVDEIEVCLIRVVTGVQSAP